MSNTDDERGRLLRVALTIAARGWPVFPLRPLGKRPALHPADRCPGTGACASGHLGWEQRATTDPDRIRRAWGTKPGWNIGVATGPAGLVVVDLDVPDPADPDDVPPPRWARLGATCGTEVLALLAAQAGQPFPDTHTVATPSGGWHLMFQAPTGPGAPQLRNTAGERGNGLGWKVDTRAHGGYIVAAGSRTPAGTYRVVDAREPVPLPGWLLQRLRPTPPPPPPDEPIGVGGGRGDRYVAAAIRGERQRVLEAPPGQRNHSLYLAAVALGQLVAGGALAEHEARAELRATAAPHIAAGAYSPIQAEKTISSGLRAGARRPRRLGDAA
jgi:Bifunctional DNA primase/polymerase, N-terminal